jgi:hypothetical protein
VGKAREVNYMKEIGVMVVDGGEGDAPEPKDGMAAGMLLVLDFGFAEGPDEGAGRV